MKYSVLIVDDETPVRESLAQVLSESYKVLFASSGEQTLEIAKKHQPALILLDTSLPDSSGIEIARQLRSNFETRDCRIIMMGDSADSRLRIQAYKSGVDDFFEKPIGAYELVARVSSKMKRVGERQELAALEVSQLGKLKINFHMMRAKINDATLDLGNIEFKILKCLTDNKNQVVTREKLHSYVWLENPGERALDPHIASLRKKLESSGLELKTIYGTGYKIVVEESAGA